MNDLTEYDIYIMLLNYINEKGQKNKNIKYFYILIYKNE